MSENGLDEVSIYPNPLTPGAELTIEVPVSFEDGQVQIVSLKGGESLRQVKLNGLRAHIATDRPPHWRIPSRSEK